MNSQHDFSRKLVAGDVRKSGLLTTNGAHTRSHMMHGRSIMSMQHALLMVSYLRWQSMRYKQHAVQAAWIPDGPHSSSPSRSLRNAAVSTWLRNPALSQQCSRVERGERLQHLRHCPHMQGSDCTSYSTSSCQARCNCRCRCRCHTGGLPFGSASSLVRGSELNFLPCAPAGLHGICCVACASLLSRHLVQPWRLKCCAWTRERCTAPRLKVQPTGCL